jgi:plasmid stability protein
MQEKQDFEGTATVEELDDGLEASLRACHHMVAEYRAMLIAAFKDDPSPHEEKNST